MLRFVLISSCVACAFGMVLESRAGTFEKPLKKPVDVPNKFEDYGNLTFVPANAPFEDDPNFPGMDEGAEIGLQFIDHSVEPFMPVIGPNARFHWRSRLLVWPEQKFAFCFIEKNACTQFNILMNKLNHRKGIWQVSNWYNFLRKYPVKADGSKRPFWRYAVFTRDPAERFLSAWSSKCQAWEGDGIHCLGRRRISTDTNVAVLSFEQMVETQLKRYDQHRKDHHGFWNAHYDPQTSFCGLNMSQYDFVGRLHGDFADVRNQVHDMLQRVARAPAEHPVWNDIDYLFPSTRAASNKTVHNAHAYRNMETFFRRPSVYDAVCNNFAQDYSELNFTRGLHVKRL